MKGETEWMRCEKNPTKSKGEKEQKSRRKVKNFKKKTTHKNPEGRVVVLASEIFFYVLSKCFRLLFNDFPLLESHFKLD